MQYRHHDYYSTCPDCGAHLDPGESCDCQDSNTATQDDDKETKKAS